MERDKGVKGEKEECAGRERGKGRREAGREEREGREGG